MGAYQFEGSVVLPATPEVVFDVIGDPANGPTIDPMIRSYEPEGGVMREGGLNNIRGRLLGLPYRAVTRTDVWDRPRLMILTGLKPSKPVAMSLTEEFSPHIDGTLVIYRVDIRTVPGAGLLGRIMRRAVARNFERAVPRLHALIATQPGHKHD